tara:strand:+ start:211 stop:396 length:186 start_codon:yes stop_codon:yes gene_type:complete
MFQLLKEYRFLVFMLPPTLVKFVDLLLGVTLLPLAQQIGSGFFILARMSVPDNFGKGEKQP